MTPKIIFRRSWLYDEALIRRGKYKVRPAESKIETNFKRLNREWSKYSIQILRAITTTTKLKWHEREIVCYITWGVIAYSDPLTLSLGSDIDTLTHELIHRIISEPENWKRMSPNWHKLLKKYKREPQLTKAHIVVHAIHAVILKKLFGKKRLQKEINKIKNPAYIRAWKIVERDGDVEIIKTLTEGL